MSASCTALNQQLKSTTKQRYAMDVGYKYSKDSPRLKDLIKHAQVIRYNNFKTLDASKQGIGAILLQQYSQN